MDRRTFLISSGVAGLGALFASPDSGHAAEPQSPETFSWNTGELEFTFSLPQGRLRQHIFLPSGIQTPENSARWAGVEVGLLCSGEDSPDSGMKQAGGSPGQRLQFVAKDEQRNGRGKTLTLRHKDAGLHLDIQSHYEAFDGLPVVRRHVEIVNTGTEPVGIEYLSSAMLHGLADPVSYDRELKIWLAYNSWMAEGQWHSFRPSELGFVENMRTSWSQASAASVGSWSTEKYLPMAVVENTRLGVAWFWQIEHNGSWYWEVSNLAEGGIRASDVYAYLGGPDQLHSQAWKNLEPGKTYTTVPVAIGCVRGGFQEAAQVLTTYRAQICVRKRPAQHLPCAVIFNDYMNCLWGDPTEEKELPLIDAAAEAGCEYFVIDAGWYAEQNEDWSSTVGAWQSSKTRWPRGIRFVLATGNVGGEVVKNLHKRGVEIRALVRKPEAAKLPSGVEVVAGDQTDPESIRSAVKGVDKLFLLNAVVADELTQALMTYGIARRAGVNHVTYVSVYKADRFRDVPHFASKVAVENALREFGIPFTILRPGYFFQNDLTVKTLIEQMGIYPMPIGTAGISAIDSRDLAEAAAVTLAEAGHEGQTYDLVSSSQISGPGNAALWSKALGKDVFYTGHDFDAWEKQMSAHTPGWMAYDMRTMLEGYVERGFASTEGDVSRVTKLLGHAPRTYEAFVQEATAEWSESEQR